MENEKGIVTGHFISHWGVPKEIRPRTLPGVGDFAILEFAPSGTRTTWRYATNGMSSYAHNYPDGLVHVRTELYCSTKEEATWVDALLAAIATYPLDFTTYLAEGDTINIGQPIDRHHSRFTGIFLARPGLSDPEAVGLVTAMPANVLVHQVVGILPSEAEFAEQQGGKALWERLVRNGDLLIDDDSRLPVA